MIPVTKPFLPPESEYNRYIDDIWKRNWLTNNGPLVKTLESELKKFLNVNDVLFLSNGTIAIQIAIKALELKGEIITTPFSYVATTSSIVWEGCRPCFVDINSKSWNIDADKIEASITPNTCAILATHVFGNPCEVDKIQDIANRHNLKVIYDAAHAFGVTYQGTSLFNYGDISTTSFHATKLFHTVEGGAVFTKAKVLNESMSRLRNFGHTSSISFDGVGVNGKNSEFHAAMGLANLNYINEILATRKKLWKNYESSLANTNCVLQEIHKACIYNYSYFPVLLENEKTLLNVMTALEKEDVICRRYFYPSLSGLNYVEKQSTPISDDISSRIMCLPLYHTLSVDDQNKVVQLLIENL